MHSTAAACCSSRRHWPASSQRRFAVLTYRGLSAVWPIYALSAVGAAVSSFDLPARQALASTLVPREHLPNAIALNSILFQTASVAGPALAGLVIAHSGVAAAYLYNALSFGFVIGAAPDAQHPGT